MLYVGLTTSLSLVINVPIILRSLANSLALILTVDLLVHYDLGVIATLDTGVGIMRVSLTYSLCFFFLSYLLP